MKNLLIIGDSFASDWKPKYSWAQGWVNLLSKEFQIHNLAQAGVGEFKILQQLKKAQTCGPLSAYHAVIVCHTSPYRVHTRKHPVHHVDVIHKESDLMINDIQHHAVKPINWFNLPLWSARRFFLDHYDIEYQETLYEILQNEIHKKIGDARCLSIKTSINRITIPQETNRILDIEPIEISFPGLCNHLSTEGNQKVCAMVSQALNAQ
jgi:hypothetical protein